MRSDIFFLYCSSEFTDHCGHRLSWSLIIVALSARLGQKEETAGVLEQCITIIEQLDGEDMLMKESELLNELAQVHSNIGK